MATPTEIRAIALEMANANGLINLTRQSLCDRVGIKDGSFPGVMGMTFTELTTEIRPFCTAESLKIKPIKVGGRTNSTLRKDQLINSALDCFEKSDKPFMKVTRFDIAEVAGVSEPLITHHLGTMTDLRRDVIRHAIVQKRLKIIAQGLAIGDAHACKAPQELKDQALALLAMA